MKRVFFSIITSCNKNHHHHLKITFLKEGNFSELKNHFGYCKFPTIFKIRVFANYFNLASYYNS